jgi:hemerythrin-like metal-binding protein
MSEIAWSDEYLLGIDEIDGQHQQFFDLGEKLFEECLVCESEHTVEGAMKFLEDYANRHFTAEVAFMRKHGYPEVESHIKLHEKFLQKFGGLNIELEERGPSQQLADMVLDTVQKWLVHHITHEDTKYAAYIRDKTR